MRNDKIKLLELTFKKVSDNPDFFAHFLCLYMEQLSMSQDKLLSDLSCDYESYLKLGLCRAPDILKLDYLKRLKNISEFTKTDVDNLNKILKEVHATKKLKRINYGQEYLTAARDSTEEEK